MTTHFYIARAIRFVLCSVVLTCTSTSTAESPIETTPAVKKTDTASAIESVDVFVSGQDGYHTYRIPAIVATQQGTLLAFCEARKSGRSDTGNIDTLVRRSTDQGKTWSDSIVVWDDGDNTCGNPAPVVDQSTGTIWLPLTWNLGSDDESEIKAGTSDHPRRVFITHSNDDGLTWAEPTEISQSVRKDHWRWYATGPGNAIQLADRKHAGRLLIPANHSDHSDPNSHYYRSHVFWSDDHGQSWQLGGVHEDRTNESAVIEREDGSLLQAMRSYHGTNQRAMATSNDGGRSWSKVYLDPALDTPVCQASMLRYPMRRISPTGNPQAGNPQAGNTQAGNPRGDDATNDKSRLLFASPKGKKRKNLHVWVSDDEGKTWPISKQIDAGDAAYCNLIALPGGQVGLLYEKGNYQSITLATFPLWWLESSEPDRETKP